jgi:hypothetical protein
MEWNGATFGMSESPPLRDSYEDVLTSVAQPRPACARRLPWLSNHRTDPTPSVAFRVEQLHNFVKDPNMVTERAHQTIRATPAMEAGLTDRVWTIAEIVGLLA